MTFDNDMAIEQGLSSEQGQSSIPLRQISQTSGPFEVTQLKEMQNLFTQLEDLRQDVWTLEEEKVEKQKKKLETMTKINQLFLQADKTNQEFKDIPNSLQACNNNKEEEINEDLLI